MHGLKRFFFKNNFFLYQLCILKIFFFHFNPFKTVLILTIRAVFLNAFIKMGKTLALTVEGFSPLFRIARKSSYKFSQLFN